MHSDDAILFALIREGETRHRTGSAKKQRSAPSSSPHSHTVTRKRCTCGVCNSCLDNARWERIFQEKFADPHYYERRQRSGSSLGK
jgi:hypothetical protein